MYNTLEKGDILIVNRGLYKHYGIYAGNKTVIHYAALNGDFGDNICIHEAPLEQFAHEDEIIVGRFTESFLRTHTLYNAEETVNRARSRLGERQHNLGFPLPNLRILRASAVHKKIPFLSQNLTERLYSL